MATNRYSLLLVPNFDSLKYQFQLHGLARTVGRLQDGTVRVGVSILEGLESSACWLIFWGGGHPGEATAHEGLLISRQAHRSYIVRAWARLLRNPSIHCFFRLVFINSRFRLLLFVDIPRRKCRRSPPPELPIPPCLKQSPHGGQ